MIHSMTNEEEEARAVQADDADAEHVSWSPQSFLRQWQMLRRSADAAQMVGQHPLTV